MTRKILSEIICFLFVLLFVYAALTKLLDYEKFVVQVGQSPLLTPYAGFTGWFVPSLELFISALFAFPKTRLVAFYAGFTLMVMFTAYIVVILGFSDHIPCSCGGVLEKMSWGQHLLFNLLFVVLAVAGIVLQSRSTDHDPLFMKKDIPLQQESGEAENLKESKLLLF
jgi:uncharacterized membrane protein YphA (DoxX/SURF4 family)